MDAPQLRLALESEIPTELAVGSGTAVFACGWCFAPCAPIEALDFILDGRAQPVMAHGMPRLDPLRALHPTVDPYRTADLLVDPDSAEDPRLHSYRSGFWGLVRIEPRPSGPMEIDLRATLQDGSQVAARLAAITVVPSPPAVQLAWDAGDASPRVVVCMATYNPPAELFRAQVASLRAQEYANWRCLISDDCSDAGGQRTLEAVVDGDPRFVVSRSPQRLGFYRNFERALTLVPPDADLVALSDQDDRWHPDKLSTLVRELGTAQLVYSDARVLSEDGDVIAETWWTARRNNHHDIISLLSANAVTGAASLLRRELLDDALPFPPAQFAHFHDHWLGLAALARGDIAYVDRALYDYVQHGEASLGHAAANRMTGLRERLLNRRGLHDRVGRWRLHYFVDVCRLLQLSTILQMRLGERMPPAQRAALQRFERADRELAPIAWLALRGARELLGTPETLGAEWMLTHAFAWRRLLSLSARDRPQARLRLDALPPPSLVMAPGRREAPPAVREIAEKIAPLRWSVAENAPARVNLLIPTVDLQHLFGGYIAKFNLARRLARAGCRVRIVTVDPVGPLPADWQRTLEAYSGLEGLLEDVELAFGREATQLEVSRDDRFIATTWWTAHIAHHAAATLGVPRFLYLIQEYETLTFAMGTLAALADESYRLPHFGIFSSELLRDYFRRHRLGVFTAGPAAGDRASLSFQNAITDVGRPSISELAVNRPRRLLFYARPESHAARNMYEMGVLALSEAVAQGALRGWELHGIGTVGRSRRVALGDGAALELLPRSDQASYGQLLREHDVGLALMYTPHPSLVPLEMASAGMLTVTNTFENKTAEAMAAISGNLIAVEPSIRAIAAALGEAAAAAGDLQRRVRGSRTRWSRDWTVSFDDALIGRIVAALDGDAIAVAAG